jgi:hypothetical protein
MAYLNFPSNPSNGDLFDKYIYNGTKDVWDLVPNETTQFFVNTTKPSNPKNGTGWLNPETGKTYVYYVDTDGGQWIATSGTTVQPLLSQLTSLSDILISSAADGQILQYDATAGKWKNSSALKTDVIKLNGQTISANYTVPSGYNGLSAGPVTIANNITVTVTDGSVWSVV